MASQHPFIPLPAGSGPGLQTYTYEAIGDDAVQSQTILLDAGDLLCTVSDAITASRRGAHERIAYRRTAGLGAAFARRISGINLMQLAAYDTPLLGTTGSNNRITVSVRANGALEIENRSGNTVDVTVSSYNSSPV